MTLVNFDRGMPHYGIYLLDLLLDDLLSPKAGLMSLMVSFSDIEGTVLEPV